MKLDFTKQRTLYQRGYETEEQRRTHDELIEQGYTCIDAQDTPFTASEPARDVLSPTLTISPEELETASKPLSGAQGKPTKQALILLNGELNVSALFRDIFNFVQNFRPTVDVNYWRENPSSRIAPPIECESWERTKTEFRRIALKYGCTGETPEGEYPNPQTAEIDYILQSVKELIDIDYRNQRDRAKADPASVTASGQ